MVAERNTKRAVLGIMMMDSSHTTPRSLSLHYENSTTQFDQSKLAVVNRNIPLNGTDAGN